MEEPSNVIIITAGMVEKRVSDSSDRTGSSDTNFEEKA